jgi:hypothetical protein
MNGGAQNSQKANIEHSPIQRVLQTRADMNGGPNVQSGHTDHSPVQRAINTSESRLALATLWPACYHPRKDGIAMTTETQKPAELSALPPKADTEALRQRSQTLARQIIHQKAKNLIARSHAEDRNRRAPKIIYRTTWTPTPAEQAKAGS